MEKECAQKARQFVFIVFVVHELRRLFGSSCQYEFVFVLFGDIHHLDNLFHRDGLVDMKCYVHIFVGAQFVLQCWFQLVV